MYSRKRIPSHDDYSKVVVQTVPGLSYSIAELLNRVVRNQPIPMMMTHDDSGLEDPVDETRHCHTLTDEQIEQHIDQELANPVNDPDFGLLEAKSIIAGIDEKAQVAK